jgi:hypothetical protein
LRGFIGSIDMAEPKPKKRRYEGFIHEKIDNNIQRALTFLAKAWEVPEQEVPRRAIQEMATHEALTEGVQKLKQKPGKHSGKAASPQQKADGQAEENARLRDENARLRQELDALKSRHKALEGRLVRIKNAVSGIAELLDE